MSRSRFRNSVYHQRLLTLALVLVFLFGTGCISLANANTSMGTCCDSPQIQKPAHSSDSGHPPCCIIQGIESLKAQPVSDTLSFGYIPDIYIATGQSVQQALMFGSYQSMLAQNYLKNERQRYLALRILLN